MYKLTNHQQTLLLNLVAAKMQAIQESIKTSEWANYHNTAQQGKERLAEWQDINDKIKKDFMLSTILEMEKKWIKENPKHPINCYYFGNRQYVCEVFRLMVHITIYSLSEPSDAKLRLKYEKDAYPEIFEVFSDYVGKTVELIYTE